MILSPAAPLTVSPTPEIVTLDEAAAVTVSSEPVSVSPVPLMTTVALEPVIASLLPVALSVLPLAAAIVSPDPVTSRLTPATTLSDTLETCMLLLRSPDVQ